VNIDRIVEEEFALISNFEFANLKYFDILSTLMLGKT